MRGTSSLLAALALAAVACSSSRVDEKVAAPAARKEKALDPRWRPGSMPIKAGDEPVGDEMALEGGHGTLDQREVSTVLEEHLGELTACAEQAGPARRYLEGQVTLRFFVTSEGAVSSVLVVSSGLGNFAVERCLAEQGRALRLPAPHGRKATDFQYALQFRPTGETAVVDRSDAKMTRAVAHLSPRLDPCGEIAAAPVKAVMYIEPGGQVGSVGLASESPLDVEAASCAVEQMRRWRLREGKRKVVVRTSFDVVAPDERPARLVKRSSRRRAR